MTHLPSKSDGGIYRISCLETGRSYIGSALKIRSRWNSHRSRLNLGKHHSIPLQIEWDRFGPEHFAFEIIESVSDLETLLEREQFWIDAFKAHSKGFNVCPTAGSPRGSKAPPFSDQRRKNISAALIGRKRSDKVRSILSESHKGICPSFETRMKMVLAQRARRAREGFEPSKRIRSSIGKTVPRIVSPPTFQE